jgi:hypothetical protein
MRHSAKAFLSAFLFTIFSTSIPAAQNYHTLKNSYLEILIDLEHGNIAQIYDLQVIDSSLVFDSSDTVLQVTAGDLRPARFSTLSGDSSAVALGSNVFRGDSSQFYLGTVIRYRLIENRLTISYCFEALERMELTEGIAINLYSSVWDSITIHNHFSGEEPVVLGQATGPRYCGLNQLYKLHNGIRTLHMLIPNPYHSIVTITPAELQSFQFHWHVLIASEPFKAIDPKGPQLTSVLIPGTRVYRQIELILTNGGEASPNVAGPIAYFSPFPQGWEQVIAMTFDDIPFGSFRIPKSGHDPDAPKQQYLVRLLEDHPRT